MPFGKASETDVRYRKDPVYERQHGRRGRRPGDSEPTAAGTADCTSGADERPGREEQRYGDVWRCGKVIE